MALKDQIKENPWKVASTVVGVITGIITVLVFGGNMVKHINEYIVTDAELAAAEQRIVAKIEKEAVLTRSVYIQELIERKTKLTEKLDQTKNPGQVARLIEEIRELNEHIDKLRGK